MGFFCEGSPRCVRCGLTNEDGWMQKCRAPDSEPTEIISRGPTVIRDQKGLGDYTEQVLKSIGITQDRYKAAKELFGLAPTCGCDKRKDWLNKVSDWWRGEEQPADA